MAETAEIHVKITGEAGFESAKVLRLQAGDILALEVSSEIAPGPLEEFRSRFQDLMATIGLPNIPVVVFQGTLSVIRQEESASRTTLPNPNVGIKTGKPAGR